jgi:hypothetical protein
LQRATLVAGITHIPNTWRVAPTPAALRYNPFMFPSRRSIRVPEYDYSQPGKYFVTLVSYQRKPSFGCINHEGQVEINPLGKIVHYEWLCLKEILPVELDEFVIMPNHFHAILVLPGGNDLLPSIPHKGLVSGSLGTSGLCSTPRIFLSGSVIITNISSAEKQIYLPSGTISKKIHPNGAMTSSIYPMRRATRDVQVDGSTITKGRPWLIFLRTGIIFPSTFCIDRRT